jgi:hypothetical protein
MCACWAITACHFSSPTHTACLQGDFEGLRTYLRKISVDAYNRKKALIEDFEPGLMNEAQR